MENIALQKKLIEYDGKNQDDFVYLIYYEIYEKITWSQKDCFSFAKWSFCGFISVYSTVPAWLKIFFGCILNRKRFSLVCEMKASVIMWIVYCHLKG